VSLPGFPALGGTPEAALAAAQERLGMLAAGHSYVTWAGLEDRDFETLGGSFDLVTLDASAGRSGRTTAGIDEAPSVAWLDRRRRETGIEVPVEVAMDQSDFEEIAATRFKELRGRLLDKRDFTAFAEVARENYANSVATTMLLSLTIDALATAADKAKALDTFVRTALGYVGKHQNVSDARFDIAYQAISHRLLFRLAPTSIAALAPVLFGADGGIGLTQPVSGLLANRGQCRGLGLRSDDHGDARGAAAQRGACRTLREAARAARHPARRAARPAGGTSARGDDVRRGECPLSPDARGASRGAAPAPRKRRLRHLGEARAVGDARQ